MNSINKPSNEPSNKTSGKPSGKHKIIALIVAAGISRRAGGAVPKQYIEIYGKSLLKHAVEAFSTHPEIYGVRVVIAREHHLIYKKSLSGNILFPPVIGGKTRQESVRRGLQSLKHANPSHVLVHDAARPLVNHQLIDRVIAALDDNEAVIPALSICDTLRRITDDKTETVNRENLYYIQTPQGFHYESLLAAHEQLAGSDFSDDAALFEKLGRKITAISGEALNFKVTIQDDIKRLMNILSMSMETRTASGFDVHALKPHEADTPLEQQSIKICGINIPHSHYLEGHSDADVGTHALVDALLGTICEGDIGSHFPPDDRQWKGADSDRFLLHAFELLTKRGGVIVNLDLTLICERPKFTPYKEAMRNHIAQLLKLETSRISIKATTTEKLGFTGRGEGIAAQATATVLLPAGR